jgi:hypothetical protein
MLRRRALRRGQRCQRFRALRSSADSNPMLVLERPNPIGVARLATKLSAYPLKRASGPLVS